MDDSEEPTGQESEGETQEIGGHGVVRLAQGGVPIASGDRRPGEEAVVIGGSMAGLLAARVLADRFDRVTVVDPAEQSRRKSCGIKRLTLAHDFTSFAKLDRGRDFVQRNVGGTECGPEVIAVLAEPVSRGPGFAEELTNRHPVVLAGNSDHRRQVERAPRRQVLRCGGGQARPQSSRGGHRDTDRLVKLTPRRKTWPRC
jgi:hypothetical protein